MQHHGPERPYRRNWSPYPPPSPSTVLTPRKPQPPPPHLLHGVYALIGPLPETEAKQGREECMAKGHSDKLASGLEGGADGKEEGYIEI